MSGQQLVDEKARADIDKLRRDADQPWWRDSATLAALTVCIAVVTFVVNTLLQRGTQQQARRDSAGRATSERQQRLDERFESMAASLVAESLPQRTAGASAVQMLLSDADPAYAARAYLLLRGLIELGPRGDGGDHALLQAFAATLRHRNALTTLDAPVSLAGLKVDGIDLSSATDLTKLDFSNASLVGASLHDVDMSGATFNDCEMLKASIIGSRADGARFRGARLRELDARDGSMQWADLTGARAYAADFRRRDLTGTTFESARLQSARFDAVGTILHGCDFSNARVAATNFDGASIDDATLDTLSRARDLGSAHLGPDLQARVTARQASGQ